VHLQAGYRELERRDAAARRLAGLEKVFLGERLVVDEVARYPMGCVPAERWMLAAARAAGVDMDELPDVDDRSSIPWDDAMAQQLRLQTWRVLYDLCDERERWAMGLHPETSLHWAVTRNWIVEAEVHGGRTGVFPYHELPFLVGDFAEFDLVRKIGLRADGVVFDVHRSTAMPGENDPFARALDTVRERAYRFNDHQPRLQVTLEPAALTAAVQAAQQRELADATALFARMPLLARDAHGPPTPWSLLVLIDDSGDPQRPRQYQMLILRGATDAVEFDVRLMRLPMPSLPDPMPDLERYQPVLRERFGCLIESMWWTSRRGGIAKLLGHREEDVELLGEPRATEPSTGR